jgi:hypothetical protein
MNASCDVGEVPLDLDARRALRSGTPAHAALHRGKNFCVVVRDPSRSSGTSMWSLEESWRWPYIADGIRRGVPVPPTLAVLIAGVAHGRAGPRP